MLSDSTVAFVAFTVRPKSHELAPYICESVNGAEFFKENGQHDVSESRGDKFPTRNSKVGAYYAPTQPTSLPEIPK